MYKNGRVVQCVASEAPHVETRIHRWLLDGVRAGRACLDLAEFILTPVQSQHCHSFSNHPPHQHQRLGLLRLRRRCGPPTPAPVYPASPRPTSAGWPAGCPTPGPSSPRSSAAQDTQHTACTVTVATTTENTTPRHKERDPVSQE